jgi:hypothetical protein
MNGEADAGGRRRSFISSRLITHHAMTPILPSGMHAGLAAGIVFTRFTH